MSTPQGKRTAIYVRVSTTKESQKDSPEHQEANCREKARQMELEVLPGFVYEDRDTGTNIVSRPAIQQLLLDAQAHAFDVVIFAALSRFSRDALDSLSLKKKLVDTLGIRLISLEEGFDSLHNHDELKFQIISAVNQTLSQQISFSTKRGLRQSALKGNYTGSIAPYGYKKTVVGDRKTLLPDEETKPVVQLIFKLYTADLLGEKAIVKLLNEELRIKSPKNGLWGISSVQRILQNEVYIGMNVFHKYEAKLVYHDVNDLSNRSKKLVRRDKRKWERAQNPYTHEGIIEPVQFELAQDIRRRRSGGSRGGVRRMKNVFAGYIRCAHCGASMVSMKTSSRSAYKEYRYLICSRRRRQGDAGCSNSFWLPYAPFKTQVMDALSACLLHSFQAEELLAKSDYMRHLRPSATDKQLASLHRTIEHNRHMLHELRKELLQGRIDQRQYEFERASCELAVSRAKQRLTDAEADRLQPADIAALEELLAGSLRKLLQLQYDEEEEFEAMRFTLQRLIDHIIVSKDGSAQIRTAF